MTVAEPHMELNQESKQFNAEKLSPKKEQSPGGGHEECGLTSANTSEETLTSVSGGEELDVDIVESDQNNISTTDEDPNATEYSSSFSDTASEDADMSLNGLTEDADVESHYWDETDLGPAYDSFSSIFHFRKKRLTNHWKSFIRPLMWRSKWAELRIRELESRALEYPKELQSLDQEKLGANIDPSVLETCGKGIKSLPFSNPSYRKRAAKRRKRKKVESTDDISSYMSHHNLFSYIETKRLSSDGMSVADDFGAAKDSRIDIKDRVDLDDDDLLFDRREGDSVLEEVLWKIELVHSQVHILKSQVDVVMSKNAARFSSSENLSLLAASSAPSPTISAGGDVISIGAIYNSSQHMPDYVLGDLVFSSGVISSYGDAFHIPDIIESTVGLFADADVTLHHPQIGDSCEDILDNILIRNGVAEEMNADLMETSSHEEAEKAEEGEGTSVPPLQQIQETEQDHQEEKPLVLQDSVLRSCLASEMLVVPRNKRTRGGERKASSWCKKHLSDPESQ